MLESLFASIEASAPARALRISFVAYPLVSAAHILGAGGLVTAVWLMHVAALDGGPLSGRAASFRRLAVAALGLMALTGLALFSVKPGDYAANPAFRVKMALIAAGLLNVALYHLLAVRHAAARRVSVTVSLLAWPAVLLAGRFIGFV